MTWLSFDDGYTRLRVWDGLPYDTRWHYHAVVEFCIATCRWDGKLRWADAERCSDVPDPARCIKELVEAGLLDDGGDTLTVTQIDHHAPPEGQRPENLLPRKRANQAEYRRRQCEAGNHSKDCPPETCPVKVAKRQEREAASKQDGVTEGVTDRVTGQRRDGSGSTYPPRLTPEGVTDKSVTDRSGSLAPDGEALAAYQDQDDDVTGWIDRECGGQLDGAEMRTRDGMLAAGAEPIAVVNTIKAERRRPVVEARFSDGEAIGDIAVALGVRIEVVQKDLTRLGWRKWANGQPMPLDYWLPGQAAGMSIGSRGLSRQL